MEKEGQHSRERNGQAHSYKKWNAGSRRMVKEVENAGSRMEK